MADALDRCGWEKVLVHFDCVLPVAHNKIAAMTKFSDLIYNIMGYREGTFVMDHAADWLSDPLVTPSEDSLRAT